MDKLSLTLVRQETGEEQRITSDKFSDFMREHHDEGWMIRETEVVDMRSVQLSDAEKEIERLRALLAASEKRITAVTADQGSRINHLIATLINRPATTISYPPGVTPETVMEMAQTIAAMIGPQSGATDLPTAVRIALFVQKVEVRNFDLVKNCYMYESDDDEDDE